MNFKRWRACMTAWAAILVLTVPAWAAAPDLATPEAAAQAFYKVYAGQPRTGALPNATARMHYAPVLSARLNTLLVQAEAAQVRFSAHVKGVVPPMIGGDLFTSNFDGATKWSVERCTGDGGHARCTAALSYSPPAGLAPGTKPLQWRDTLDLVHTQAGWKVDDVVYDPGFATGNTGTLSRMLKMMVAQAPR